MLNLFVKAQEEDADVCVGVNEKNAIRADSVIVLETQRELLQGIDFMDYAFINVYSKIYKREIITEHSILFDERLKVAEDMAFNLDFYSNVRKAVLCPDCGYHYRIRSNSLIHQVTLPTKQKYVWDHACGFVESIEGAFSIETIFEMSPYLTAIVWEFGLLNRLQSDALEGDKSDMHLINETPIKKVLMNKYRPNNMKNRILSWLVKKNSICIFGCVIRAKYFLFQNCKPLYTTAKSILVKKQI